MNIAAEIAVKVDEKRQELTNQQAILDYFIERQRLAKEEQVKLDSLTNVLSIN